MDDADRAGDHIQNRLDACISHARREAEKIPAGLPGQCDYCGEWSGRLVNSACAPCRDRYEKVWR